ncbi:MAG: dephospho-CoA kinase, partial [Dehalococcoidia bacterium]
LGARFRSVVDCLDTPIATAVKPSHPRSERTMYVIGLTGGIGSGKSAVAALLTGLGAAVIDADKEGHRVYERGSSGWQQVLSLFGPDILDERGEVDRRRLGAIVFGDARSLERLNAAVHPVLRQHIQERLQEFRNEGDRVAVVDAALLHQAGWDDLVDEVWAVTAPEPVVIQRLQGRGLTEDDARQRMGRQQPPESIAAKSDVVIENTGTLEELRAKVEQLWNERILLPRQ